MENRKNIGRTFAPLLVATLLAGMLTGAAGIAGPVGVAAAEEATSSEVVASQVGACGRVPAGCYLSARALLRELCARCASTNAAGTGAGLGLGMGAGYVDEDADGICDNYEDGLCGTGLGAGLGAGAGQGNGQGWGAGQGNGQGWGAGQGAGQGRGCGYGARR